MKNADRVKRLATEQKIMQALAEQSSIIEFEAEGDRPKEYKVTLRGKGIAKGPTYGDEIEYADTHEFVIRLGATYPDYVPEVRCQTDIFHPNVSSMGFIRLEECGLPWNEEMTLDVVCERLWDVVRAAYVNMDGSSNYFAKKWYDEQTQVELPVDPRSLRDRIEASEGNVVRYERVAPQAEPAGKKPADVKLQDEKPLDEDVLYIDDATPPPPLPKQPGAKDDVKDDVLYIGDE